MSITSQAARSTGSLFGTISSAATTVGSVFNAATKSVQLLDNYVSNALEHQQERIDADNAQFSIGLQIRKAQEMAELYAEAQEFQAKSPEHHANFQKSFDLIGKAIEEGKARRAKLASATV